MREIEELRPLLARKNFVKSSKTIQFEIMLQELKVKCFMRDKCINTECLKQKGIKNFRVEKSPI